MIALTRCLPGVLRANAEYLKIKCLFDCYQEDDGVLFWSQDGGRAFLSLADGDMTLWNGGGNLQEIREFLSVISPRSLFSDYGTLRALGFKPMQAANVMCRKADLNGETAGDSLSSKEIYDLLNTENFYLPDYPFFAVDFCRRLNRGQADYFALKNKCAAVSFHSGGFALLNGIVSRERGCGTLALKAILQKNRGRELIACCADGITGFYEKNGFQKQYRTGYWWKQQT